MNVTGPLPAFSLLWTDRNSLRQSEPKPLLVLLVMFSTRFIAILLNKSSSFIIYLFVVSASEGLGNPSDVHSVSEYTGPGTRRKTA